MTKSLHLTGRSSAGGVTETDFTLGEVTGVLWLPANRHGPTGLVLMGHGGGLHKKTPALLARAREEVLRHGLAVVAIDAPGHGDRPLTSVDERARRELREAKSAGENSRFASVSSEYGRALAERAVPEWRATLDALQQMPEIGAETPIGYGGGITLGTGIGIPLTAVEPRISTAIFGGGFFPDDTLLEAARGVSVPVQFLLPWDDEHVDRSSSLALFDAFASTEKILHANPGDHRSIRWYGLDRDFLARQLHRVGTPPKNHSPGPEGVVS